MSSITSIVCTIERSNDKIEKYKILDSSQQILGKPALYYCVVNVSIRSSDDGHHAE